MSIVKSFFDSVKGTLEGNDGKISSRKTAAFWFTFLATLQALSIIVMQWLIASKAIIISSYTIDGMRIQYDFYFATLGVVLLLFGVITLGQVQSLRTVLNAEVKKEEAKNTQDNPKPENTEL